MHFNLLFVMIPFSPNSGCFSPRLHLSNCSCNIVLLKASKKLTDMLETMDTWIGEIPPIDQPQRFGNKAFRTWCGKLEEVRQDETY